MNQKRRATMRMRVIRVLHEAEDDVKVAIARAAEGSS